MALQQTTIVDLIQVDETNTILVRQRTDIFDDATPTSILASNYHRNSFAPSLDLTGQDPKVIAIAKAIWTPEVIAAYQATIEQTAKQITGA